MHFINYLVSYIPLPPPLLSDNEDAVYSHDQSRSSINLCMYMHVHEERLGDRSFWGLVVVADSWEVSIGGLIVRLGAERGGT